MLITRLLQSKRLAPLGGVLEVAVIAESSVVGSRVDLELLTMVAELDALLRELKLVVSRHGFTYILGITKVWHIYGY